MLALYHWEPNAHFLKPLLALAEKQAEFVGRWFDPTRFEQFAPDFPSNTEMQLNLECEGPVLVHADAIISHSFFMLEYISDALPGPVLLAQDSHARYLTRAWSQALGASIGPVVSLLGCARYLAPLLRARDVSQLRAQIATIQPEERRARWLAVVETNYSEEDLDTLRQRLRAPVKRVDDALGQSRWLAGAEYSIADIDAFALLDPLVDLAPEIVNERASPRVCEFLHRMHDRAAVRTALSRSRSGTPRTAFVPGVEFSRWG
jgi:GSH-dependent disulfide-bond oxidoreductase